MICADRIEKLRVEVGARLSDKRYAHTLGVERAAVRIGEYCLPDKITELAVAALLHDVAKEMPREDQLAAMERSGIAFTAEDYDSHALYHAFAACVLVREEFSDIATDDILSAVFKHTSGDAEMSVFDEIGLFDENFESYVEDMDLSFRARLSGYKSYYSSKAKVYHHGSATTGSRYNPFKVKISARNNVYLIYKNMPLWMKIINALFIVLGILIKYVFFTRKNLGQYYINGIKEGLSTKNKLTRTKAPLKNSLKIEYMMIKNTFTYFK